MADDTQHRTKHEHSDASHQSGPAKSSADSDETDAAGDALREQQAIAAAMMLGEKMRREERNHLYWYAKRIGMFAVALALVGLVMLFGYVQLTQGDFSPTVPVLLIGGAAGLGAVLWYWAHTEERRSAED